VPPGIYIISKDTLPTVSLKSAFSLGLGLICAVVEEELRTEELEPALEEDEPDLDEDEPDLDEEDVPDTDDVPADDIPAEEVPSCVPELLKPASELDNASCPEDEESSVVPCSLLDVALLPGGNSVFLEEEEG